MVAAYSAIPYTRPRFTLPLLAIFAVLAVQGCSKQSGGQAVVSGRDGFEIPLAEFQQARDAALSSGSLEPPSATLQRVVDQQLFANEAKRERLDRDWRVVQAIEAAKRGILASAYADRLVRELPQPSEIQVENFYSHHPELFAKRKILSLDEIAVRADPAVMAELKKQFMGADGSLVSLQESLQRKGLTAPILHVRREPEKLDLSIASRFSQLKVGDAVIYQSIRDTHFAVVTAVELSPLSVAQAAPQIRDLLSTQARRDLVDKDGARLQAAAKLTYAKGYAPVTPAGP